jgi:hypothetical protein
MRGSITDTFPRAVLLRRGTEMTAHLSDGSQLTMRGVFVARSREGDTITLRHVNSGHTLQMPVHEFVEKFEPRSL